MTLLIKSDKAASKHLGNIYGVSGAYDFTSILDFERGIYKIRDGSGTLKDIEITDAITATQSAEMQYCDEDGIFRTAEPDTPRIHYIPSLGKKGLLVTSYVENLFLNSDTPVTQTINASSMIDAFKLRVTGGGSAAITGAVDIESENNTASDGIIVYGKFTAGSVTVTISGSPTRVELLKYRTSDINFDEPPVISGPTSKVSRGDLIELNSDLFNELFGKQAGTVVAQVTLLPNFSQEIPRPTRTAFSFLDTQSQTDGGGKHAFLIVTNAPLFGGQSYAVAAPTTSFDVSNASTPLKNPAASTFTVALRCDGAITGIAVDSGQDTVTFPPERASDLVGLVFGGVKRNSGPEAISRSLNGVINKLATFDRYVSAEEIKLLSESWK